MVLRVESGKRAEEWTLGCLRGAALPRGMSRPLLKIGGGSSDDYAT
jgi:hypothetical protein